MCPYAALSAKASGLGEGDKGTTEDSVLACEVGINICSRVRVPQDLLDCPKSDLNERIYQRFKLTLACTLRLGLTITPPGQDDSPEVDAVHVLPIVHLFV